MKKIAFTRWFAACSCLGAFVVAKREHQRRGGIR